MANGTGLECNADEQAQCRAPNCVNALAALAQANNQTAVDCQKAHADASNRTAYLSAALGLMAAAIALWAVAFAIGPTCWFTFGVNCVVAGVLNVIALGLALAALIALGIGIYYQIQLNSDNAALSADLTAAQNAANTVMTSCPVCCQGNLMIVNCGQL